MSAAGYAAHRSSFTADDWWRMEAAAFRGEHAVRDALALTAPSRLALTLRGERSSMPGWRRLLTVPQAALIIGALALPTVWGLPVFASIFIGGNGLAVGVLGIVAAVSALLGLLMLRDALSPQTRAERGGSIAFTARAVPTVLGAIGAAVWLASGAEVDDALALALPVDGAWTIPMFVDAAMSVAMLLIARRTGGGAPTLRTERSVDRLAAAVDALPAERRDEIARDLRTAIDVLEHAGAIDASTARRARSAPLGQLAPTMAPERAAG